MNVAVVIGVSRYSSAAALPACRMDAELMRTLLAATGKYSEILVLSAVTESGPLKEALRGFFGRHQAAESVEEVVFYFSGHGTFHSDALLCCSDFDPHRPSTTSLSNSEVDDLLRSLNPAVAVKIIDACQSGSPYIKDAAPGFEKALRESRLKSFICMASSRADQSSYVGAELSVFTDRLADAALARSEGTVLYRDIQASLADAFASTPEQTPFFVVQGTGLEAFATITVEMRALAERRTREQALPAVPEGHAPLVERIVAEVSRVDRLYISAEEAARAVKQAGEGLERAVLSNAIVARFYDMRCSREGTLAAIPASRALAQFAQEQGWAKKYFVNVEEEVYHVRVPIDPLTASLRAGAGFATWNRLSEEYSTETRRRPLKVESTQPLPFEVATVVFEPRDHPALKAFALYLGLVHSLTEAVVLSAHTEFIRKGWAERAPDLGQLQWRHQAYRWRDVAERPGLLWEAALQRVQEVIQAYLETFAPKKEEALAPAEAPSRTEDSKS